MSAQENAEAIILVIKKVAKWFLMLILILGLLFSGVLTYDYLNGYYKYDRHKKLVFLSATFDNQQCTIDYPLLIIIENSSTRKIMNVDVDIKITQVGKSTRLNGHRKFKDDTIISPNKIYGFCNSVTYNNQIDPLEFNGTEMVAQTVSFDVVFE